MKGKKYSLSDYIVTISPDDADVRSMYGEISVGGNGNYLGSVSVSYSADLWTTRGYATGAYTQTKSLDRTGTIDISLNQLSDEVAKFINLCKLYFDKDYDGFTISISNRLIDDVAICEDCYIKRIPTQEFNENPGDQTWSFTCGVITIM